MLFNLIITLFYYFKNHIKPIELPMYQWEEVQLSDSLGYEWVKAKFYATKNWVEIYAWMFGNNDNVDNKIEKLIIPKWKVVSYGQMKIIASSKDYKRYWEWHNE